MAIDNQKMLQKVQEANGQRQLTVADKIKGYLSRPDIIKGITEALPKHMTPQKLTRVCFTTIQKNPQLLQCSVPSILTCIIESAQLGLEPNALGHCYFVPYADRAQFQIGYRGMLELIYRAEKIQVDADVVYARDRFIYKKGFNIELELEPARGDRGEVVGAYACAILGNGARFAVYLSIEELGKIKAKSKSANSGSSPWTSFPDEMRKKSAIRRLFKTLPVSIELQELINKDEDKEFATENPVLSFGEIEEDETKDIEPDFSAAKEVAQQTEQAVV